METPSYYGAGSPCMPDYHIERGGGASFPPLRPAPRLASHYARGSVSKIPRVIEIAHHLIGEHAGIEALIGSLGLFIGEHECPVRRRILDADRGMLRHHFVLPIIGLRYRGWPRRLRQWRRQRRRYDALRGGRQWGDARRGGWRRIGLFPNMILRPRIQRPREIRNARSPLSPRVWKRWGRGWNCGRFFPRQSTYGDPSHENQPEQYEHRN